MEATNQTTATEGVYAVDYQNCINFSGEHFSETAVIEFEVSEAVKPGQLCIYKIEGMSKFGLAHLSEKTDDGVIFEFTEGGKKSKSEFTPFNKVKNLYRVDSSYNGY